MVEISIRCLVKNLKMKFDQDLRYDFGKMNSTLGSVVPLAMFKELVHLIRGPGGHKRVEEMLILNATKSGCTTLNLQHTCHNVTRQR